MSEPQATALAEYYELLQLPRKLSIDPEELQRRYYELSRQLHPDRFMRHPEAERQHALELSSVLNDGYRTLRDPVKRAMYFLKREGFEIGEQRSHDVPPELLEEVFELNMALEEMRSGDDSMRPQLEAAARNFTSMLKGADDELEDLFEKYDNAPGRATLEEIRAVLNRRKYIENLVRQVEEALQ